MRRFAFVAGILLPCLQVAPALAQAVEVALDRPGATHRLGEIPEEGIVVRLQVAWEEAGSLMDTVGAATPQPGNVRVLVLADGSIEASVYDPRREEATDDGWVRLTSAARLAPRRPHRVTLAIGPSLILIVDGKEEGRIRAPHPWPAQTLHLGACHRVAEPGGKGAARAMVGRVLVEGVGPGDADFTLVTLEGRASAMGRAMRAEVERISRRMVTLTPEEGPGFLARARALVRLGDLAAARNDLDVSLARSPELPSAWKLRAWVRHELGDVAGAIADLERFLAMGEDAEARQWLQDWRREADPFPGAADAVVAGAPLIDVALTPADSEQVVEAGETLRLRVPPAVLAGGGRLSVAPASPRRAEVCGTFESFGMVDVRLMRAQEEHELADDLTLECRYDPARLDPDLPIEEQVLAARWDPERGIWIELPSRIDANRGLIVTTTRHLSILAWLYRFGVVLYEPIQLATRQVIRIRRFQFYYDPSELAANKWIAGWRGEPSFPPEYAPLWNYEHPAWTPFVRDLAYYLDHAYDEYEKAHLTPAADLPVKVEIGPGLAGSDPAMYHHAKRRMYVSSDKVRSSKGALKHKLAHELFHAIQNKDLHGDAAKVAAPAASWWIESTAEYAACRVAWTLDSMGGSTDGVYPFLLERPLTEAGAPACPHGTKDVGEIEYDKGYLLDHLVRRGCSFRTLYKTVTEQYRLTGKLLEPFEACLVSNGPDTLPAIHREYAGWFLFASDSPRGKCTEPDPLLSAVNPRQQPERIPAQEKPPALRHAFRLQPTYTASTWAIRAAPGEPPSARVLTVTAPTLDAWALVDLYVLPDGERTAHPVAVASLTDDKTGRRVALQPGQTLFVTVVNLDGRRPAEATVDVAVLPPSSDETPPDADLVTIEFSFHGTRERSRSERDEESEEPRFVQRTAVEPLEIDVRHGGLAPHPAYVDMPVRIQGRRFFCVAKIEGSETHTTFDGTFSEGFQSIQSLEIRHRRRAVRGRVWAPERGKVEDGVEYTEEYTITVTDIRRGEVQDAIWPYALEFDRPAPMSIPYSVVRRVFLASDGSLNEAGSWNCLKGEIRSGRVSVLFHRK